MMAGPTTDKVIQFEWALHLYHLGHKEESSKKGDLTFLDMHWGTKTMYYVKSICKVHIKKYNQIITTAWPYCRGHRHLTGNNIHTTVGTEAMETYGDNHAQIMVYSTVSLLEVS